MDTYQLAYQNIGKTFSIYIHCVHLNHPNLEGTCMPIREREI